MESLVYVDGEAQVCKACRKQPAGFAKCATKHHRCKQGSGTTADEGHQLQKCSGRMLQSLKGITLNLYNPANGRFLVVFLVKLNLTLPIYSHLAGLGSGPLRTCKGIKCGVKCQTPIVHAKNAWTCPFQ